MPADLEVKHPCPKCLGAGGHDETEPMDMRTDTIGHEKLEWVDCSECRGTGSAIWRDIFRVAGLAVLVLALAGCCGESPPQPARYRITKGDREWVASWKRQYGWSNQMIQFDEFPSGVRIDLSGEWTCEEIVR